MLPAPVPPAPRPSTASAIIAETLRGLSEPRRWLPLSILGSALLVAQVRFSADGKAAMVGLFLALSTTLIAPCAWRVASETAKGSRRLVQILLFGVLGAVWVPGVANGLGAMLAVGHQFLTEPPSMLVCVALFIVGGWGLGQDIEREAKLLAEQRRATDAEKAAEQAQLLALRAHLDPHFLFNTLNAIAEWCRQDGEVAERAVLQLASILRTILEGIRRPTWSLAEELALVRTLFELHGFRDPSRFRVEWEVPEVVPSLAVPPMLFLPLAENAIKHGPAAGHRGAVKLAVAYEGDTVRVTLENPGPYRGPRDGSSGLPILRQRLAIAYGPAARFDIADHGGNTRATLSLPASHAPEAIT